MKATLPADVIAMHAFLTGSVALFGLVLLVPALLKWLRFRKVYAGTRIYDHRHLYMALLGLWLIAGGVLWYIRFFVPLLETLVWMATGVPILAALLVLWCQKRLPSQRGLEKDRDEYTLDE